MGQVRYILLVLLLISTITLARVTNYCTSSYILSFDRRFEEKSRKKDRKWAKKVVAVLRYTFCYVFHTL